MAHTAADLLRRAFVQGFALSGGPMTDRVKAGCTAAVELGLAHLDDPRILEATLRLGHLEGVWAQIYARRDQMHADNRAVILALWRPMVADLDIDAIARRGARAAAGVGEADLDPVIRRQRQRVTQAVLDELRQLQHTGSWRALRGATGAAIRRALAEGRVGALAYNADQLGKIGLDWSVAFDDAYKALADIPGLLEEADGWLTEALDGQASEIGRRLASLAAAGASRGDMVDAVEELIGQAAPVGLVVDMLTARAMSQGALDLYTSEGVALVDFLTAGDVRVCQQCADAENNSPYRPIDAPVPGLHPLCRCTLVATDAFPMPSSSAYFPGAGGIGDGTGSGALDLGADDLGADDLAADDLGADDEPDTEPEPAPEPEPEPGPGSEPATTPAEGARPSDGAPSLGDILDQALAGGKLAPSLIGDWVDGKYAGLDVKVTSVKRVARTLTDKALRFKGTVRDPDTGKAVGKFERLLGRDEDGNLYVDHELLEIKRAYQGSGFQAEFNDNLIDWYRRSDAQYVKVLANIDVGGYAWARAGYDFRGENEALGMFTRLKGQIAEILGEPRRALDWSDDYTTPLYTWNGPITFEAQPAWTQQQLRDAFTGASDEEIDRQLRIAQQFLDSLAGQSFGADDFPTPYELSQLGRWDGAGKDDVWIGKLVMLGSTWLGILAL